MLTVRLAAVVTLGLCGATADVARATTAVAEKRLADLGSRPSKVSGYGDVLAWSVWDRAQKRFRLVARVGGGAPQRLRVTGRRLPFDVDVGPGRDGRPLLVYSRCRVEPDTEKRQDAYQSETRTELAVYDQATGCDLYSYSVASGREQRLLGVSSERESEYMPSVWRGNIAFARRAAPSRIPRLYLRRAGSQTSTRLGAGPSRNDPTVDGPVSLDLRGTRLAYHWHTIIDHCADGEGETGGALPFESQIRVVEPGGRARRVALSCSDEAKVSGVQGGVWSGRDLLYAQERDLGSGRTGVILVRSSDGTSRQRATYALDGATVQFLATDDNRALYGTVAGPSRTDSRISELTG